MRALLFRARWLLAGVMLASTIVTLWAQEAQVTQRGLIAVRGPLVASTSYVYSGGSVVRDYRVNTAEATAGAATYTAAELLAGLIQRTPGNGGNVTDVLPSAANLYLAMPTAVAGTSFFVAVDMGASPGGTVTMNGASTGVTYSGGCGTAIGTSDVGLVLITFTSTSAYRAVCLNVNT